MKQFAAGDEATGSVVRRAITDMDSNILANLPAMENMKRDVRRERKKNNHHPVCPKSASDIVIPDQYKVDCANNRFLLADTRNSLGKRVMVFITDSCLDVLQSVRNLIGFLDGTFKTAPKHFTQTLILRVQLQNDVIPVAYAFLEDKTTSSYRQALQELKTAAPLGQPGGDSSGLRNCGVECCAISISQLLEARMSFSLLPVSHATV